MLKKKDLQKNYKDSFMKKKDLVFHWNIYEKWLGFLYEKPSWLENAFIRWKYKDQFSYYKKLQIIYYLLIKRFGTIFKFLWLEIYIFWLEKKSNFSFSYIKYMQEYKVTTLSIISMELDSKKKYFLFLKHFDNS